MTTMTKRTVILTTPTADVKANVTQTRPDVVYLVTGAADRQFFLEDVATLDRTQVTTLRNWLTHWLEDQ